jgi:hypothetical protein
MTHYMLAVHSGNDTGRETVSPEAMQESWKRIQAIEEDLKTSGAWLFSGRLHGADSATVVRALEGEILTTDGPYVESKEHLGGFYIIAAEDLDHALGWASRVSAAINMPIEVRTFAQTAA